MRYTEKLLLAIGQKRLLGILPKLTEKEAAALRALDYEELATLTVADTMTNVLREYRSLYPEQFLQFKIELENRNYNFSDGSDDSASDLARTLYDAGILGEDGKLPLIWHCARHLLEWEIVRGLAQITTQLFGWGSRSSLHEKASRCLIKAEALARMGRESANIRVGDRTSPAYLLMQGEIIWAFAAAWANQRGRWQK